MRRVRSFDQYFPPAPLPAKNLCLEECLLMNKGPTIKYVTLFLANFDPLPPLSHFVTHSGTPPQKYVTHLGLTPIFSRSSTNNPDKSPCTNSLNCSPPMVEILPTGLVLTQNYPS